MHVLCGQCGHSFDAPDAKRPGQVQCPQCGSVVGRSSSAAADGHEEEGFASQAREMMSRKVRVVCGKCGRGLKVPLNMAGRSLNCPACTNRIRIPYPDEVDEASLPAIRNGDPPDQDVDESVTFAASEEPGQPGAAGSDTAAPAADAASANAPAQTRRPTRKKPPLVALVVGGLVLAVLLGWAVGMALTDGSDEPVADPTALDGAGPSPNGVTASPVGHNGGAAQTQKAPSVVDVEAPAPRASLARMQVTNARTEFFAADGYYPAAAQNVYWVVTVAVSAGSDEVNLATHGDGIVLKVGGKDLLPLGVPAGGGSQPLPPRALQQSLRVKPNSTQAMTLLFEVPVGADSARLAIRDVGSAEVAVAKLAAGGGEREVLGNFAEKPPRNLKPLLANGVMSALQQAAGVEFSVRREREELRFNCGSAGVWGTLKPLGAGLYEANLGSGRGNLKCHLRLIDGGKAAILYLSDKPFHQMTFVKK